MTSQTPGPVEYLEEGEPPRRRGNGRRWGIAAAATVGVLGVVGGGAFAVTALTGGGPGAATAVPGNALGYLALDLDPGADQKIEAYQFLRKFPAIGDRLGDGDDLRRSLVEAVLTEAPCDDLDFAADIDPWLGSRVAVAALPGDDEPAPLVVVQVKDEEKARAGVEKISACDDSDEGEDPGIAFTGDYMVLAEDAAAAQQAADDAEAGSLADDDAFTRWVDEAGGAGIVTAYVSPAGAQAYADVAVSESDASALDDVTGDLVEGTDPAQVEEQLAETLADFEGAAAVLRFADEGIELQTASSTVGEGIDVEGGDSGLADLPGTTAVALGFGVGDDTVQAVLDMVAESVGQEQVDQMLETAEAQTGLSLPEDLQTVLGDGVSVALDSSIDVQALVGGMTGGLDVPAGLRITGDPDEIVPVLEKLVAAAGVQAQVVIERGDGAVAVGVTPDYVSTLAGDGDLGEQDGFTAALPDVEESVGGVFVDFDADDWLTRLLQGEADRPEVTENLEPLDTLGVTGSVDGDVTRGWVRLSTD